jgi:hypothetical protein
MTLATGINLRARINPNPISAPISHATGLRHQDPTGTLLAASAADPERIAAKEATLKTQSACRRPVLLGATFVFVIRARLYSIPIVARLRHDDGVPWTDKRSGSDGVLARPKNSIEFFRAGG